MGFPDTPNTWLGPPAAPPPVRVVFGCESVERGEIYNQEADGLMGLGNNNNALQSQVRARACGSSWGGEGRVCEVRQGCQGAAGAARLQRWVRARECECVFPCTRGGGCWGGASGADTWAGAATATLRTRERASWPVAAPQLVSQKVIEDTFYLCFGFPNSGVLLLGERARTAPPPVPSARHTRQQPLGT